VNQSRIELARFFVAGSARNGIEENAGMDENKLFVGYDNFPGTASSSS